MSRTAIGVLGAVVTGSTVSLLGHLRNATPEDLRYAANVCGLEDVTALMVAAHLGTEGVLTLLLRAGADINRHNRFGSTALMRAAEAGHIVTVKQLVDAGADPSAVNQGGWSVLMAAVTSGHFGVTQVLVSAWAALNAVNYADQHTALMMAAWKGFADIVQLLVSAGADLYARGRCGETALDIAMQRGSSDICAHIIWSAQLQTPPRFDPHVVAPVAGTGFAGIARPAASMECRQHEAPAPVASAAAVRAPLPPPPAAKKLTKAARMAAKKTAKGNKAVAKATKIRSSCELGINHQSGEGGDTPLMLAAVFGNASLVTSLLRKGADPRLRSWDGSNALMKAVCHGSTSVADVLIQAGADVEVQNDKGYTALHIAARGGTLPSAELLLSSGADINIQSNMGETALILAAKYGHTRVVQRLLAAAADRNLLTLRGESALLLAQASGHMDVVNLLTRADPHITATVPYLPTSMQQPAAKTDWTALQREICEEWETAIPAALYGFGSAAEEVDLVDLEERFESHERAEVSAAADDANPLSRLCEAVYDGDVREVDRYPIAGGDLNAAREEGRTTAPVVEPMEDDLAITEPLLQVSADVNTTSPDGRTLLMDAVVDQRLEAVKQLLGAGVDVNAVDQDGATALMHACHSGALALAIAKELLAAGADVRIKNMDGESALALAVANRATRIVKVLLKAGAPVESDTLESATGQDGWTMLMWAASVGSQHLVEYFLARGGDPYERNLAGETAIDLAQTEKIGWLLKGFGCAKSAREWSPPAAGSAPAVPVRSMIQAADPRSRAGWSTSGADVAPSVDQKLSDAFVAAAQAGTARTLKRMIAAKHDVNCRSTGGITALTAAARVGRASHIDSLLKAKANVDVQGKEGRTALMEAARYGHDKIVQKLLKARSDLDMQDWLGGTALMHAAKRAGNRGVVELLVVAGAALLLQNQAGETALMLARKHNRADAVDVLIAAEASSRVLDSKEGPLVDPAADSDVVFGSELSWLGQQLFALGRSPSQIALCEKVIVNRKGYFTARSFARVHTEKFTLRVVRKLGIVEDALASDLVNIHRELCDRYYPSRGTLTEKKCDTERVNAVATTEAVDATGSTQNPPGAGPNGQKVTWLELRLTDLGLGPQLVAQCDAALVRGQRFFTERSLARMPPEQFTEDFLRRAGITTEGLVYELLELHRELRDQYHPPNMDERAGREGEAERGEAAAERGREMVARLLRGGGDASATSAPPPAQDAAVASPPLTTPVRDPPAGAHWQPLYASSIATSASSAADR